MALSENLRHPQNRASGRYTVAMGGIVTAWIILMLGALYSVVSGQSTSTIIPPLERAINLVIILLAAWGFLTADQGQSSRKANILLLVCLIAVLIGYVLTGIQWANAEEQANFNLTIYSVAWTFISLVVSLAGIFITLFAFRSVTDAPLKILFFVLLVIGAGVTLLQISQFSLLGNYAGTSRLAMFAALAILPAIIYRTVIGQLRSEISQLANKQSSIQKVAKTTETATIAASVPPPVSPVQRDSIQLLKTLGLILEDSTPNSIPEKIVTSVLDVLKADIGAILNLQDANYADVTVAYDKSMKRRIAGMALNLDNQPTLVNAIERRSQRPLYPDRNTEELRDLYNRLDIEHVGPVYWQPLTRGKDLVAILMVGMPYTQRELDEPERELLKGIGIIAGNLLALSYAARDARLKAEERAIQALVQGVPLEDINESSILNARQEMQASLQASREQIAELTKQISHLKIELDAERNRVTATLGDTEEGLSVSQRILTLTDEYQKTRDEREQLAKRLQEAETALAGATASSNESVYKHMIDVLRREKEDLLQQRDTLQRQLTEIRGAEEEINGLDNVVEQLGQDNTRLAAEREEIQHKLADVSSQLQALGIESSTTGLAQLIGQLTEQRNTLQSKIETLTLERNALLNERVNLEDSFKREKERSARLQVLETEISNLASDREVLIRERDQLRIERDDLIARQDAIKQNRARLLAEASGYQLELAESHQEQAKLRVMIQKLSDEKSDQIKRFDQINAEKQAFEAEKNQLIARIDGDRERVQTVGETGIGSLTKMIEEITEQRNQLERELNEANTKLADTQNKISELEVRTQLSLEENGEQYVQKYDPDLTLRVVQELRTPLTSIMGYIDLLMDESAGILGEMQRKFLQRVAANVTRLSSMTDDLTRITALDSSRLILVPRLVNVVELIEDTISNSTYQFREKGLTIHLNLDDSLPAVKIDYDAMTQVINQLLTNAYLSSPPDSQIFVTAHQQTVQLSNNNNLSAPTECILISVEDRGGGIPSEELPRVFTRRYKSDNPVIKGLGDSGVGLSIAKTLVEAHGGGLWVETRSSVGSIFYIALPTKSVLEAQG